MNSTAVGPGHPIHAEEIEPNKKPSVYPPSLAARVTGRSKRKLGDVFGLTNFGVNLTTLPPGSASALRHAHARQDEFVYVLSGAPTLITDEGRSELEPGMCIGFKAGTGNGHCVVNFGTEAAVLLEIGDRTAGDSVLYPDDDLCATLDSAGNWQFSRKDGTRY